MKKESNLNTFESVLLLCLLILLSNDQAKCE